MDSRDVITDVVATPDGERFGSVSWYKTVSVSDLTTQKRRTVRQGHINRMYCLRISGDGKNAMTGSGGGTAHIWDLDSCDGPAYEEPPYGECKYSWCGS